MTAHPGPAEAAERCWRREQIGAEGIVILLAWTVALGAVAGWLYRRDALRPSAAGTT